MFCPKCGSNVGNGAKFCSNCGAAVYKPSEQGVPQYTPPIYEAEIHYDCGLQRRDIAVAVILSIVTFGIYGIYWFVHLVNDVNRAANDQNAPSGGVTWLLSLVTFGIYGWYWYYQAGKKMAYAKEVRHMPGEQYTEILYLLLAVFGLGIVTNCLIQSDLNKMA